MSNSGFNFRNIYKVDYPQQMDDQSKTKDILQGQPCLNDELQEHSVIPTELESLVGHSIPLSGEVVVPAVCERKLNCEDVTGEIEHEETRSYQAETFWGWSAEEGATDQRTLFEEVKGEVVNELPSQIFEKENQTEFENVIEHSVEERMDMVDPAISTGKYRTTNSQLTNKVSPPRLCRPQETNPEILPFLLFGDELNKQFDEETTSENNISQRDTNDTQHQLPSSSYKRKYHEDDMDRILQLGKKLRTDANNTDIIKYYYNLILSHLQRQMSVKICHLWDIPFKVSYKLELFHESDMSRFLQIFLQKSDSQYLETTNVNPRNISISVADQNLSIDRTETDSLSDFNQSPENNNAHISKAKPILNEEKIDFIYEDISSDENTAQDESEVAGRHIKRYGGESKLKITDAVKLKEVPNVDEVLDLSCEETSSMKKKKSSNEFYHPEVNFRGRGKQPKSGKQHVKKSWSKKNRAKSVCHKTIPPEIDKSDKAEHFKQLRHQVTKILDVMESPPRNMPNIADINPEVLKKSDDEEKPNNEATKFRLYNFLKTTKPEAKKEEQKFYSIVSRERRIKTEEADNRYEISTPENALSNRSVIAREDDRYSVVGNDQIAVDVTYRDRNPCIRNDQVAMDDSDEDTWLYGFDGPNVKNDENYEGEN